MSSIFPSINNSSSAINILRVSNLNVSINMSLFNANLSSRVNTQYNLTSIVSSLQALGLAKTEIFYEQQAGPIFGNNWPGIGTEQSQGESVAISSDGNTVALGCYGSLFGSDTGAVYIFVRLTSGTWIQQAGPLLGTGAVNARQSTVAISATGNTLAIGGPDGGLGQIWIFQRTGTSWAQQAGPLVGSGSASFSQGNSLSMSGDGNTVAVGSSGTIWMWFRTGTSWAQQGGPFLSTGRQSIAISQDGYTVMTGNPFLNGNIGAVWIFTKSGVTWSLEAGPLTCTLCTGPAVKFGESCSLSANGNTAIIGGIENNDGVGAAWIFTRTGTSWAQTAGPLVGTGYEMVKPRIGSSVSITLDGNTVLIGGDGGFVFDLGGETSGQSWIFKRNGLVWEQKGTRLIGTSVTGAMSQGYSVSMSADASTFVVGGPSYNGYNGAMWIFKINS